MSDAVKDKSKKTKKKPPTGGPFTKASIKAVSAGRGSVQRPRSASASEDPREQRIRVGIAAMDKVRFLYELRPCDF
jgi:hypothetical protein